MMGNHWIHLQRLRNLYLFIYLFSYFSHLSCVKIDNLFYSFLIELPEYLLKWHVVLVGAQDDLDLRQGTNNGLILGLVDALKWPQYSENIRTFFILFNWLHARVMVFLVAQKHVVQQGALAWKECAGNF